MPDSDQQEIPEEHERLHELLMKIVAYQHSLPDGRAVEMDELRREGLLAPADMEFLSSHSVTYKPHRVSDYHGLDTFHMPTPGGGCVFIGPSGPALTKRRARLREFQPIVESFLQLPRPKDELLLHIELSENNDWMAVAPELIGFGFTGTHWRERLPAFRAIAVEFGFNPVQDEVVQESYTLTFSTNADAARTARAAVLFLGRGCGFTDETELTYSAGALDEG